MAADQLELLRRAGAPALAYRRATGRGPAIVWCGGFRSDMKGTKAAALHEWALESGRAFIRFDYSGHGESEGAFEAGTISAWLEDTLAILDLAAGPVLLIGSSMGGWLALLAALRRPVAAMMLIAPAPDFTERLIWPSLSPAAQRAVLERGRWATPSAYSPNHPTIITRGLIEDGRAHLLLQGAVPVRCPVRIVHGQRDPDAPWRLSLELAEKLESEDVAITLVKDGDHRLSRPQDIALLLRTLAALADSVR
jgi:pimeloyl-ACP methyl ester carboxylesterase